MKKYNVSVVTIGGDGLGETCFSSGKYGFCLCANDMKSAISAAKKRVSDGDKIIISLLGKNGRRVSHYSTDFFELMSPETQSELIVS